MKAMTLNFNWRALALEGELSLLRWGWVRVLAACVLAAGAVLLAMQLVQLSRSEADLKSQLAARRDTLQQLVKADPKAAQSASGMDPLLSLLGEGDRVEQYVQQVFAIARATGIHLGAGEYRWMREAHADTDRYQMRLPVKGRYAEIRIFCEQVLAELPFASLDDFSLKRDNIGEAEVEAQLQFSFHLHPSAAAQAGLKGGR